MMLRFASFLFLAVAVVADTVPQSWRVPKVTTNRERLARNLPPLPPKFGRTLPGYADGAESPTRVHVARASPMPSALRLEILPPVVYTGRIEVRSTILNLSNSTLGFLENTEGGFNGINLGGGEDLHVTFNVTPSRKEPFDILAKNPNFTGPVYLGGKTTDPSTMLSAISGATLWFSNVEQTPPRSRPVKGPSGFGESSIWTINPVTKEITAHWINPDGSPAPTGIAYDIQENIIFFTGNVDIYNSENHASASLVGFFLASD